MGSAEGSGSGSGLSGQEVLVVDADKKVLFVLEHLLTEAGMGYRFEPDGSTITTV